MKVKLLFVLVLISGSVFAQYSNFYNINANINQNITGTSYQFKTIYTIDFGALALANAQREKNAVELQKFADQRQREIAIAIAEDPIKAYDYGDWLYLDTKDKKLLSKDLLKQYQQATNLKHFKWGYLVPNSVLFSQFSAFKLQNVSKTGVKTDILLELPIKIPEEIIREFDIEANFDSVVINKEIEEPDDQGKLRKMMFHKKEINRATIFGAKGFNSTFIWEDKFEICITDNYLIIGPTGFSIRVKVRYYADKNAATFEDLEGRRYYLKPLVEKIIATGQAGDLEELK